MNFGIQTLNQELPQQSVEFVDRLLGDGVMGKSFGQAAFGVHDRRVVAMAKAAADVGVAEGGQPAGQINGDVAGLDERGATRRADQGGLSNGEKAGRDGDDLLELSEVVLMV